MSMRRLIGAALGATVLLAQGAALAQPAKPAQPPPTADALKEEEARKRFERGLARMSEEAWDIALAEFLRSREILPTRSATKNAAICLRKLLRYDESLEMFDALMNFSNLSSDDRRFAEQSMVDLRPLVGFIDIRSTASGAQVSVDGRERGEVRANSPIRVSAGSRFVRVYRQGFVPLERRIDVPGGAIITMDATLISLTQPGRFVTVANQSGKSEDAARSGNRFVVELGGGATISPSLGGNVAGECEAPCSSGLGVGLIGRLHVAYELESGLLLGLSGGYAVVAQSVVDRPASVTPVGKPPNPGTLQDSLRLGGAVVGATGGWHLRSILPLTLRLGAGALIGSVRDERDGSFQSSQGAAYELAISDAPGTTYIYLEPEARLGVQFADRFEISVGFNALLLFGLSKPTSSRRIETAVPDDGGATFGFEADEELAGGAILVLVPGLGLRMGL